MSIAEFRCQSDPEKRNGQFADKARVLLVKLGGRPLPEFPPAALPPVVALINETRDYILFSEIQEQPKGKINLIALGGFRTVLAETKTGSGLICLTLSEDIVKVSQPRSGGIIPLVEEDAKKGLVFEFDCLPTVVDRAVRVSRGSRNQPVIFPTNDLEDHRKIRVIKSKSSK